MKQHNINNLTVVKHHHLNEASYFLTLDERRLILSAIAQVNPKNAMPDEIKVHASDFAKEWGIDKDSVYKQLKQAKENLYERSVRLKKLNSKNNVETWDVRWVHAVAYQDGEAYVKISFSPRIAPYLSELKGYFASYKLMQVSNFKSGHAIRMYELMMQYKDEGWIRRDIAWFKETFGVKKKYPVWAEFKRNVLDKAFKEIESKTNYKFEITYKKKGRKIDKIQILFGEDGQQDMFKKS